MFKNEFYEAKEFNLSGLHGISDETLEMHFKLYEGYVKETNRLTERIRDFLKHGAVDEKEMPAYSELTRHLGFEYNGMLLHEYLHRHEPETIFCGRDGAIRILDLRLV